MRGFSALVSDLALILLAEPDISSPMMELTPSASTKTLDGVLSDAVV